MTKDDVIRIAREAGFPIDDDSIRFQATGERVMRFAALVEAHEREECAKVCDSYADGRHSNLSDLCSDTIRARGNA